MKFIGKALVTGIILVAPTSSYAWQIVPATIETLSGECGYAETDATVGRRNVLPFEFSQDQKQRMLPMPITIVGQSNDCYLSFQAHNGVSVSVRGVGEWHFDLQFDDSHLSERKKKRLKKKDFFYGGAPEFWRLIATPIVGRMGFEMAVENYKLDIITPLKDRLQPFGTGFFGLEVSENCWTTLRWCEHPDSNIHFRKQPDSFEKVGYAKC